MCGYVGVQILKLGVQQWLKGVARNAHDVILSSELRTCYYV